MERLGLLGRKTLGRSDPRAVLRVLVTVKKMSPEEIAETFGVTGEAVRKHLRKMGLMPPATTFEEAIVKLGFRSRDAYFRARLDQEKWPYTKMAEELGVAPNTVKYQHEKWLAVRMLRAAE